MNEDDIKKRMQNQLQEQLLQNASQQQQIAEAEKALKIIASRILEPRAFERLMNLKTVKPELALRLETYLAQLYQAGQIHTKITEQDFIVLLKKFSEKKEINIKRK